MNLTPTVALLYKKLLNSLQGLGKLDVEEKKTSIHIKNRAAFAGVHPRKAFFVLTIVSDAPIVSQRITKIEQVSKSRFHNEVKIETEGDIDVELIGWLKKAHELMK